MFRRLIRRSGKPAPGNQPSRIGETTPPPPAAAVEQCTAGHSSLERGDHSGAAALFAQAIALSPRYAEAHYGLGLAQRAAGRNEDAAASLERAVQYRPDCVAALVELGRVYGAMGRPEEGMDHLRLALAHDPGCVAAHFELGKALQALERYEEAIASLKTAAESMERDPAAWFELARSLSRTGRTREAMESYRRAIEIDGNHVAAHINLGVLLLNREGDPVSAEQLFRRARALAPNSIPASVNLGAALQDQNRLAEALQVYEQALGAHPDSADLRWHRATALLLRGDYRQGWPDYEARKLIHGAAVHRHFPHPEWRGEPLSDRTLLVYAEQGIGDEIMFASCIPDLVRRGARCVIECDPRLQKIFARSFPSAIVHGTPRDGNRDWLAAYPPVDLQSAIGSVARFLREGPEEFPAGGGYLTADAGRVAYWRLRLDALGAGAKIGISWRGGTDRTRRGLRSIQPAQFLPLFALQQAKFVSLQYGAAGSTESAPEEVLAALATWPEGVAELEETAALIEALDLVVTVDNTIAHLSGALGRPVWVLLGTSPEWRWRHQGETTPWYPTARLFRQARPGDWTEVIEGVLAALQQSNVCIPACGNPHA